MEPRGFHGTMGFHEGGEHVHPLLEIVGSIERFAGYPMELEERDGHAIVHVRGPAARVSVGFWATYVVVVMVTIATLDDEPREVVSHSHEAVMDEAEAVEAAFLIARRHASPELRRKSGCFVGLSQRETV